MNEFFKNKAGEIVVTQVPNTSLWVWVISGLLAPLTVGVVQEFLSLLSFSASFVWASLEIITGESPFRRFLGYSVLAFVVLTKLTA